MATFDQSKVDQISANFLDDTIKEIIKGIIDSGQNASGDTINSLGLQRVSNNEWILFGRKFIDALEQGRGPSKGGNSGGQTLKERIYDWLPYADKYGITYTSDGERKGLAYVIARKIHEKGTNLHIQKKNTNILTTALSSEKFSKFVNQLLIYYGGVITKRLKNGLDS